MVLMLTTAALLATPVLAGPNFAKHVASLEDDEVDRYGQAIFNTNLEDGDCYELEVEVEECMALAGGVGIILYYNVSINEEVVCTIGVDEYGNGKVTCCVADISTGDTITVGDEEELTSGEWRPWAKIKGPK